MRHLMMEIVMDILSLLLLVLFVVVVGAAALWLINRFFPAGTFRTVALIIVGVVLLLVLLSGTGLLGSTSAILATPVGT